MIFDVRCDESLALYVLLKKLEALLQNENSNIGFEVVFTSAKVPWKIVAELGDFDSLLSLLECISKQINVLVKILLLVFFVS